MQKDILQTDRTLLDASLAENPVHLAVIRKDLTRGIEALIPEMVDELQEAVDEIWGLGASESEKAGSGGDGWREVKVFDSMMGIISRGSNRVFVGLPLCEYTLIPLLS